MKTIIILAFVAAGLWLPWAFLQAAELQAHIDARNVTADRLARLAP